MPHRAAIGLSLSLSLFMACGGAATSGTAADGDGGGVDGAAAESDGGVTTEGGAMNATDAAAIQVTLMSLPVGDGKYGPAPKKGYIYSCQQSFMGGGGAFKDGPWIKGDGTFDFTAKVVVQGMNAWPNHTFAADVTGGTRAVIGNGLPDHMTGTYPIAQADPAYQYDRNPNSIQAQSISWSLAATPTVSATTTCLGGGPIGILLTGSVLFDALDAEGRDAVAHETQDLCQAHPEKSGAYHYHSIPTCLPDPGAAHSVLLGYAKDGFGIYGVRGEDGKTLTNDDLDECHGHTHVVSWDGASVSMYHYHATYEYPYTLGCFRGTPIK